MGFFDFLRGGPIDKEAEAARLARQRKSEAELKRGGLPIDAVERLTHQRALQDTPQHLWTSDLSVSELSLVKDTNYEPLGQIMGASTCAVGFQWRSGNWRNGAWQLGSSYELETLTNSFSKARDLATNRLQQEARLLGADGVVGVRLHRKTSDLTGDSVEFQAIGTAIRHCNKRPSNDTVPFLCALSGQDFWKLKQAGVTPVGLVAGNCTYYCIPGINTQNVLTNNMFANTTKNVGPTNVPQPSNYQFRATNLGNQELPEFTQALYTAREIALERLSTQARALKAHGTIGMEIDFDSDNHAKLGMERTEMAMVYHFFALGTAVQIETRSPEVKTTRALSLEFIPVRRNEVI